MGLWGLRMGEEGEEGGRREEQEREMIFFFLDYNIPLGSTVASQG